MAAEVCEVSSLALKALTSLDSQATSRNIINENFKKLKGVITCLGAEIGNFLNILPPINPTPNSTYEVFFDGTNYSLVPKTYGTKYRIHPGENINIGADYQYIVYNAIENYGSITIDPGGMLVILT